MRIRTLLLFIASNLIVMPVSFSAEIPVDKTNAIRMAEEFIRLQGYTAEKVKIKNHEIVYESLEQSRIVDEALKRRHATLEPSAVGAKWWGENRWLVAFRYAGAPAEKTRGRAVSVNEESKKMRVIHQDVDLNGYIYETGLPDS